MAPPTMSAPAHHAARVTSSAHSYAPAGYAPARPTTYPPLPPLHYRTPGSPVTASQAHQSTLDEARASKRTNESSTRLKSLVAFFVFWVVVSSLFLFLYVDRMI